MSRPTKRAAVEAELLRDHDRTNEEIAAAAGCSVATVKQVREALLADGTIPRRKSGVRSSLRARVQAELLHDHERPNQAIAMLLGCSEPLVSGVRAAMVREGQIPAYQAWARPFYAAICAELHRDPHRPNTAIARAVGCSDSRVWLVRAELEGRGEIPPRRTRHDEIVAALRTWQGTQKELARHLGVTARSIRAAERLERERQRVREVAERER